MRIILSRKGFDSSAGGVPSPILPGGRPVSLPIPDPWSPIRYGDIGRGIDALVSQLTRGRIRRNSRAHLDPDLVASDLPRPGGWRPLFGQAGAAQGHLARQGVGPGDLFLFFGLFQPVKRESGRWVFDRAVPRRHCIWGWLQIGEVIPIAEGIGHSHPWALGHPHCHRPPETNNTLYAAREGLELNGRANAKLPGAGVFTRLLDMHRLSAPDAVTSSSWRLPAWMHPGRHRPPVTYHADPGRWRRCGDHTLLQSAGRGQEFVLSARHYSEALPWAESLIANGRSEDRAYPAHHVAATRGRLR